MAKKNDFFRIAVPLVLILVMVVTLAVIDGTRGVYNNGHATKMVVLVCDLSGRPVPEAVVTVAHQNNDSSRKFCRYGAVRLRRLRQFHADRLRQDLPPRRLSAALCRVLRNPARRIYPFPFRLNFFKSPICFCLYSRKNISGLLFFS